MHIKLGIDNDLCMLIHESGLMVLVDNKQPASIFFATSVLHEATIANAERRKPTLAFFIFSLPKFNVSIHADPIELDTCQHPSPIIVVLQNRGAPA